MNWRVILAGLSLLRELLAYLRKRKDCTCPKAQASEISKIRDDVAMATELDKDLEIII